MLLVTSNNQGELTPLEIGLHALRAVPKAKGGKGQKGGLSEYAKRIGKNQQDVGVYRQGAEVYREVKPKGQSLSLLNKAQHLAAIFKTSKRVWPIIVSALIENDWTVAETKEIVTDIREVAIPASWVKLFLPLEKVVAKMLSNKQFTSDTVAGLIKVAEAACEDRLYGVPRGRPDGYHVFPKQTSLSDEYFAEIEKLKAKQPKGGRHPKLSKPTQSIESVSKNERSTDAIRAKAAGTNRQYLRDIRKIRAEHS